MGYALENCPVVYNCCGRTPLRPACLLIGIAGLLCAALLVFLYSGEGAAVAKRWGVPDAVARPMGYSCLVLGVLLCAIHVVLLVATIFRSETFCQLYVWAMLAFLVAFFVGGVTLVTAAALADANKTLVVVLFLTVLAYCLLSLYFTVVVANFRMTIP